MPSVEASTNGEAEPDASVTAPAGDNGTIAADEVRRISGPEAEPVDLLAVAGRSTLKRVGPVIGLVVVTLILLGRRRARLARRHPHSLARLTGNLPSIGDLTDHLPDLADLAEVRSTVGRHRRTQ